jgi:hypothetical protein
MTTPETTNLYANVRNNNNIVWKNVTIVDELADGRRGGTFLIANPFDDALSLSVRVSSPDRRPLTARGEVHIALGDELFAAWTNGGRAGADVKEDDTGILLLSQRAWLGNITLQPHEMHAVTLTIDMDDAQWHRARVLTLDIVQYRSPEPTRKEILGGQRFVLKTTPGASALVDDERKLPLVFDGAEWRPQG